MIYLYPHTLLLTFLIILSLFGLLFNWKIKYLSFFTVSLLYLFSIPLTVNISLDFFISKISHRACETSSINEAVLLASGLSRAPSESDDWGALSDRSATRALYALTVLDSLPLKKLTVSGGIGGNITESDIMFNLINRVHDQDSLELVKDDISENTKQTASNYFDNNGIKTIYLITDDWHMLRAQKEFKKVGIEVCPLISRNNYVPFGFPGWFIPQKSAIVKFEYLWHELGGLLVHYSENI